jgi:uncharacterized membrane protein
MNRVAWRTGLLIALALAGVAISTYLALFELGAIDPAWDPVFGGGTEQVLRSAPARALPVPDALLGVLGYAFEVVLLVGVVASRPPARRRFVIALGAVATVALVASLGLVALQAFVVGAWCLLCLTSAAISCLVAAIAIPDALAALVDGGSTSIVHGGTAGPRDETAARLHEPRPTQH